MLTGLDRQLAEVVIREVHADNKFEAAKAVIDRFEIDLNLDRDKAGDIIGILQHYLHWLLESGAPEAAAQILWTPNQFTPEPESVQAVWQLFEESSMGLIMGAAKMGKSFSMGVRLMLEWIRDPEWTSVRLVGPSEDHLKENLFSHMTALHTQATLPMPGKTGELFIGLDRKNQLSSIRGVIIPKGDVKKAGRLQGTHRKPRPQPHPVFGPLSRLFIFIDEIENVPAGLWKDIDNVLSDVEKKGGQGFKIHAAYNPTNQTDEVGKRAEPPFGWQDLQDDKHFRWRSTRGWDVLRLDGERCENVVQNKVIYYGLQTREGLDTIAQNAGGRNSPGYRTMGRGLYPDTGVELTIIPPGMWAKWRGEFIWYEEPDEVGALDMALEGGANAVFTLGKFGKATGIKWPPSLEFPQGRITMFKNPKGQVTPRWGLLAEKQLTLPKGDTVAMKTRAIEVCRKAGIKPNLFAIDRTGNGAGVADLIKYEWATGIWDVNFSESASKTKLMAEATKTCEEEYDRMMTELWFALRAWGEFQILLIAPSFDVSPVTQPVTQRKFKTAGGKSRVESKKDFMLRTGVASPDEADSLTLFVHAGRMGSGIIPSMRGEIVDRPEDQSDDWSAHMYPGGVRIDESNRTDWLDERPEQFDPWEAIIR